MNLFEFREGCRQKGRHILNHIPPLDRKNICAGKPVFFFTCDDIGQDTNQKDIKLLVLLLKSFGTKTTFFIVPQGQGKNFSKQKAKATKKIIAGHEIAMHGITHAEGELLKESSGERTARLASAKKEMEKAFGVKIFGYRSPRFHWNRGLEEDLAKAGFAYKSDSYFFSPKPWKTKSGLIVVPAESICEPISQFNFDEKKILGFMEKKLEEIKRKKKQFVFLFHIQSMKNKKAFGLLEKTLALVKQKGIPIDLSLADFVKQISNSTKSS